EPLTAGRGVNAVPAPHDAGLVHELLGTPRVVGVLGDDAIDLRVAIALGRYQRVGDDALSPKESVRELLSIDRMEERRPDAAAEGDRPARGQGHAGQRRSPRSQPLAPSDRS